MSSRSSCARARDGARAARIGAGLLGSREAGTEALRFMKSRKAFDSEGHPLPSLLGIASGFGGDRRTWMDALRPFPSWMPRDRDLRDLSLRSSGFGDASRLASFKRRTLTGSTRDVPTSSAAALAADFNTWETRLPRFSPARGSDTEPDAGVFAMVPWPFPGFRL